MKRNVLWSGELWRKLANMIVTTITTADHYQHYLPMYIYVLRKECPDYFVRTFIRGEIDSINRQAFSYLHKHIDFDMPIENVFTDYPHLPSTTNCLRFLLPVKMGRFEGESVLFTDADLLLFRNDKVSLEDWHKERMLQIGSCYGGHRGPNRYPRRFNLPNWHGWAGQYERVAGGFFYATPEWFTRVKKMRKYFKKQVKAGIVGGYREADEVMLAQIIKMSGLPMPGRYPENFKRVLRGIHMGDFKKSMKKRYKSKTKMDKKVSPSIANKYIDMVNNDPVWKGLMEILCEDKEIAGIYKRSVKVGEGYVSDNKE